MTKKRNGSYVPEMGYIYFAIPEDWQAVKIGFTMKPKERLASLQCGNHQLLSYELYIAGFQFDEATIHKHLAAHRMHGEWFHASDKVLSFIEDLESMQCAIALEDDEFESAAEAIRYSHMVPLCECLDALGIAPV